MKHRLTASTCWQPSIQTDFPRECLEAWCLGMYVFRCLVVLLLFLLLHPPLARARALSLYLTYSHSLCDLLPLTLSLSLFLPSPSRTIPSPLSFLLLPFLLPFISPLPSPSLRLPLLFFPLIFLSTFLLPSSLHFLLYLSLSTSKYIKKIPLSLLSFSPYLLIFSFIVFLSFPFLLPPLLSLSSFRHLSNHISQKKEKKIQIYSRHLIYTKRSESGRKLQCSPCYSY